MTSCTVHGTCRHSDARTASISSVTDWPLITLRLGLKPKVLWVPFICFYYFYFNLFPGFIEGLPTNLNIFKVYNWVPSYTYTWNEWPLGWEHDSEGKKHNPYKCKREVRPQEHMSSQAWCCTPVTHPPKFGREVTGEVPEACRPHAAVMRHLSQTRWKGGPAPELVPWPPLVCTAYTCLHSCTHAHELSPNMLGGIRSQHLVNYGDCCMIYRILAFSILWEIPDTDPQDDSEHADGLW